MAPVKEANRSGSKTKIELKPHQIILRPLVTEKGMHRSSRHNQYAFEVAREANKKIYAIMALLAATREPPVASLLPTLAP